MTGRGAVRPGKAPCRTDPFGPEQRKRTDVDDVLGGGFNYFLFSPLLGEDFHFD